MAKQQPTAFDAIDRMLAGIQAPAQQTQNLIALAKQERLHMTSGYSRGGHNSGSMHYQGSPEDPGAIDLDPRGVTPEKIAQWRAQGYTVLDERSRPAGQAVWTGPHYHIQKARNGQPQRREIAQAQPSSPPVAGFNIPNIPAGAKVVPVDIGLDVPSGQQAQQANAARTRELVPAPAQLSQQPKPKGDTHTFSMIDDLLAGVEQAAPEAVPKPKPGFMDSVGQYLQGVGNQLGQGIQTSFNNRMELAGKPDLGRSLLMTLPVQLGAGALSETANLINGALQLPADIGNATGIGLKPGQKYTPLVPNIPTGGLEEITGLDPVVSTIGRAAPYVAGEVGLAGAVGSTAKGAKLLEAIDKSAKLRALSSAGVNAAEGFIAAPGEGGLNQRLINAGVGGVLGGGAQVGLDALTGKLKPKVKELPTPEPKFKTQADMIRSLGEQHGVKDLQAITPQEQALLDTTFKPSIGGPRVRELSEAFAERQRPTDAPQVIDPRTAPVPEDLGPLKTEPTEGGIILATRAGTKEVPQVLDAQGRPIENVNTPESQGLRDNAAANLPDNAREIGTPQPEILDAQGRPRQSGVVRELEIPGKGQPSGAPLELPKPFGAPKVRELPSAAEQPTAAAQPVTEGSKPGATPQAADTVNGNVYRTPEGGEVYTHGRDVADIQQQLAGVKGQLANIGDIERHLQTHNPDAVPAIQNILNAGKGSEAVKFSYVAREAPGEPARVRDNFVPTHFTYETIKPSTQRSYLRRKFGADDAVVSHLKQEIAQRGGSVNAASLQTKGGKDIAPANQIKRLIENLDQVTGGAYLKSPRVHGINLGETTRSAAGDRGIRLDTITDSSLTGRKVTPEELQGHTYNNQIAPAMKALDDLAQSTNSPVFKRAIGQIQGGRITKQTMRELKAALSDEKLAAQFCNVFGVKL